MALGLDGEGAAGADDDVVDVAAAEVDVVEDVPVGTEPFERRAHLPLTRRPARPAFRRRPGRGGADHHHEERDQLDLDQRQPMAAERDEGNPRDRQRPDDQKEEPPPPPIRFGLHVSAGLVPPRRYRRRSHGLVIGRGRADLS